MTGQPIAAIRIQDAILDELAAQADGLAMGAPYVETPVPGLDRRFVKIDGDVDVLAIAIRVAALVNDR